jgi:hypothetical protein
LGKEVVMKKEGMWVLEHERRHQAYRCDKNRSKNLEDLKVEITERIAIFDDLKVNYLRPEDEE